MLKSKLLILILGVIDEYPLTINPPDPLTDIFTGDRIFSLRMVRFPSRNAVYVRVAASTSLIDICVPVSFSRPYIIVLHGYLTLPHQTSSTPFNSEMYIVELLKLVNR